MYFWKFCQTDVLTVSLATEFSTSTWSWYHLLSVPTEEKLLNQTWTGPPWQLKNSFELLRVHCYFISYLFIDWQTLFRWHCRWLPLLLLNCLQSPTTYSQFFSELPSPRQSHYTNCSYNITTLFQFVCVNARAYYFHNHLLNAYKYCFFC